MCESNHPNAFRTEEILQESQPPISPERMKAVMDYIKGRSLANPLAEGIPPPNVSVETHLGIEGMRLQSLEHQKGGERPYDPEAHLRMLSNLLAETQIYTPEN